MEKAVERVIEAINNNEKVAIYGDYDVDGITSSTVLHRFLKDMVLILMKLRRLPKQVTHLL